MEPTEAAPEKTPAAPPADPFPTGWHRFHGQEVLMQLFDPYVAAVTPEGKEGTDVLKGLFHITDGSGEGELLFIMTMRAPNGVTVAVSVRPSDVKHLTWVQQQRIVGPGMG